MSGIPARVLLLGTLISATALSAQAPAPAPPGAAVAAPQVPLPPLPAPPARTIERGYTSLFNGKDLTGWKPGGPAESWSVQDGAIVAHGAVSHLFYDGPFRNHTFTDFDLKLDVVARSRSNGGVYIMTEFQEKGFPARGFEIQVNVSHTDRIRSGSLYHVVDLSHIPAKDDEWYPMEINSQRGTITVTLKGNKVLSWTQPPDWNGAYDAPGRKIGPGTIAFQAHDPGSTTAYANIRLRPLD